MKRIIYFATLVLTMTLVRCTTTDEPFKNGMDPSSKHMLTVVAGLPSTGEPGGSSRSITQDANSLDILFRWEVGNTGIKIVFKQGDKLVQATEEVTIKSVEQEGRVGSFDVEIPQEIDISQPFDLYGTTSRLIEVGNGKILTGINEYWFTLPSTSSNDLLKVPVYFEAKNVTAGTVPEINFRHLGSLGVITIKSTATEALENRGCSIVKADPESDAFFHDGFAPFQNLLDLEETVVYLENKVLQRPMLSLEPGETKTFVHWLCPNGKAVPETKISLGDAVSQNSLPARDALKIGNAYHVYATWDGQKLTITDEDFSLPVGVDPEIAAIIEVLDIIDPIADKALESDNPAEELKKVAEQFKNYPEIEESYFDRDKLMLKFKNGGYVAWFIKKDMRVLTRAQPCEFNTWSIKTNRNHEKILYPKILFIYRHTLDLSRSELNEKTRNYINNTIALGYNVTPVYGEDFNLEFARSGLTGYDGIFLGSHGSFDQNTGSTWILTGERPLINDPSWIEKNKMKWIEKGILYDLSEKDGQYNIWISENFFDDNYKQGDFSNNSFFYSGPCQTMMDPDNGFASILHEKGISKIVGYNQSTMSDITVYNAHTILNKLLVGESYSNAFASLDELARFARAEEGKELFYGHFDNSDNGVRKQEVYETDGTTLEYVSTLVSYPADTDFRFKILKLNTTWIKLSVGDERTVEISGGSGNYSISNNNDNVVLASLLDSIITLKGVFNGKAVITVTDNETKRTETITVTVPSIGGSGSVVDVPGRDL